jgi:hypothetical protein
VEGGQGEVVLVAPADLTAPRRKAGEPSLHDIPLEAFEIH